MVWLGGNKGFDLRGRRKIEKGVGEDLPKATLDSRVYSWFIPNDAMSASEVAQVYSPFLDACVSVCVCGQDTHARD